MKHLTREEVAARQLLRRARVVAIVGASPSPARHSHAVAEFLREVGYEVLPVRGDDREVLGLRPYRTLAEIPGPVELAVIFRRPAEAPAHLDDAAQKKVEAVWLQPGVWSPTAERRARALGITLVKDRCIAETYRHLSDEGGNPQRLAAKPGRKPPTRRQKKRLAGGFAPSGGGGRGGGGGVRAILDEKKERTRGPSSRRARSRGRSR